jgi:hypothetical protein
MTGKCASCECTSTLQTVTVRMYARRSQFEWRLRLCPNCVEGFKGLLRGVCGHEQHSYFNPPDARAVIVEHGRMT